MGVKLSRDKQSLGDKGQNGAGAKSKSDLSLSNPVESHYEAILP